MLFNIYMAMNGIELLSYEKGDQKPEWGILWRLFKKNILVNRKPSGKYEQ